MNFLEIDQQDLILQGDTPNEELQLFNITKNSYQADLSLSEMNFLEIAQQDLILIICSQLHHR